jgi:hypothetical protein
LERYRSNGMIGISIAVLVGNDIPERVALSAEVLYSIAMSAKWQLYACINQ